MERLATVIAQQVRVVAVTLVHGNQQQVADSPPADILHFQLLVLSWHCQACRSCNYMLAIVKALLNLHQQNPHKSRHYQLAVKMNGQRSSMLRCCVTAAAAAATGVGGPDCGAPDLRPCTNTYRSNKNSSEPASHIGPNKRDMNWTESGWTQSRCERQQQQQQHQAPGSTGSW